MFLNPPPDDDPSTAMYSRDLAENGYVTNLTRLWAWRPRIAGVFSRARALITAQSSLTERERSVMVCAMAGALGDAYCALAWGSTLAAQCSPSAAVAVLAATEAAALKEREQALATWARKVVRDPNTTTENDVAALKRAGLAEQEIFDATVFVAFRLAF